MKKVFCFGEVLIRMSPELTTTWINEASMPVYIGGAELNVASALAKWNMPVKYCTSMPDHYLSHGILEDLRSKNIETSAIHIAHSRIGTYYLPQGADLKSTDVIYDRAGSSFAELRPGMINWDVVLNDCNWFHFSAICPALNESAAEVCYEGLQFATKKGLTISVDLNYRSKLWKYGKKPIEIMPELVKHCHIIMGNIWAAESLLGIKASIESSDGRTPEELNDAAGLSMLQLHHHYPVATTFAYTFRLPIEYWAVLQHGPHRAISKHFSIHNVVDKAGSGDCFMAGLIYGLYNQHAPQHVIDFAAAAAVGKLQEKGDATNQTVEMIKAKFL